MQANQTRLIHGRKIKDFWRRSVYADCGGISVAWRVNEEGNLIVSQPARCLKTDRFERKVGAQIAMKNMAEKDPLFVITKEEIIEDSVKIYADNLERVGDLTPNARLTLVSQYRGLLESDFINSFTSRLMEELSRDKLREFYNKESESYAF